MQPAQLGLLAQGIDIAPDRVRGNAEVTGQLFHRNPAVTLSNFQNSTLAIHAHETPEAGALRPADAFPTGPPRP
ncbi:hypothetical protein [Roseibium hamelinense]|uniref:hypothetical protein n=1 Tax=Roseibium hamelinense TaxID=150831 RepID=UPI001FCA9420|nr:hypothetical protein [Roseibium hamelinense]